MEKMSYLCTRKPNVKTVVIAFSPKAARRVSAHNCLYGMKRVVSIVIMLVAFVTLEAQPGGDAVVSKPQRPKVGVTLSGGGAKGAAHIGVLKYLEEIGIPVD